MVLFESNARCTRGTYGEEAHHVILLEEDPRVAPPLGRMLRLRAVERLQSRARLRRREKAGEGRGSKTYVSIHGALNWKGKKTGCNDCPT